MGISTPRVVLGGLVAGLVINLGELAVHVLWLGGAWNGILSDLGLQATTGDLVVWGLASFVVGIVGVWIYAAAAPRYGPGWRTAVRAGFALWLAAYAYAGIGMYWLDAISTWMATFTLIWGLVEVELGVYVGAWLYREAELAAT